MMTKEQLRHFSDLSEEEVNLMSEACINAAIRYAKKVNMSGLSHYGCHNIYTMIQDGMKREWNNSREAMKRACG